MTRSINTRMVALVSILALVMVASIPLFTTAQDATPPMTEEQQIERGSEIYFSVCVACHQPDGNGVPGIYLPLNNGAIPNLEDPTLFIYTVMYGRGGMPRFNTTYTDDEIAAILTFVRQEWDNDASPVTAEQVAEVRANYSATPIVSPTPDAQIPEGQNHPEERDEPVASPDSTPTN